MCFYSYVLATIVYIMYRMLKGVCAKADRDSDMSKAMHDFIEYAAINLTWFAFNFVLCVLPPLCMLVQSNDLEIKGKTQSYAILLYILWGMNCLHFMFTIRIY
jgi:hypothetical protein